ncbi:unnamed protein product, partial [Ectocarpus sp. 12 AP-2014]
LGLGHEVPEVNALFVEVLDLEVEQLSPGDGSLLSVAVLVLGLVCPQDVDRARHVLVVVFVVAVEADVLDRVVVVGDLKQAVLGVGALEARVRISGEGDAVFLRPVHLGQAVKLVVAGKEVT